MQLAARTIPAPGLRFGPVPILPSPRQAAWGLLALMTGLLGLGLVRQGFEVRGHGFAVLAGLGAALWGLSAFYARVRREARIAATLEGLGIVMVFGGIAVALSYVAATLGGPLRDGQLQAWDAALGFDWQGYYDAVLRHPTLLRCLQVAYMSLDIQLMLTVTLLGLTGRVPALWRFVLATMLSALACIAVSTACPAVTAFLHLGMAPGAYGTVAPAVGPDYVADILGLRDGTLRVIDPVKMQGIIAFPSYHACLAVLLAAGLWQLRWLRWPALVLNGAMLAATPVIGGHYGVDVLAGMVVAGLCLAAAGCLGPEGAGADRTTERPVPAPA